MHPFMKYIVSQSADSTVKGFKNRNLGKNVQFFHKFVSFCLYLILYRLLKAEKKQFKSQIQLKKSNKVTTLK